MWCSKFTDTHFLFFRPKQKCYYCVQKNNLFWGLCRNINYSDRYSPLPSVPIIIHTSEIGTDAVIPHIRSYSHLGRSAAGQSPAEPIPRDSTSECLRPFGRRVSWYGGRKETRRPAWRTVWAGRRALLPKVRAWSIGPPHPTLLPVTALWPNTIFGALAQV